MEIEVIDKDKGDFIFQFSEGGISSVICLDKLSRYKLMLLLTEQKVKESS